MRWRDQQFWLAMAAGPVFWVAYAWLAKQPPNWGGPTNWVGFLYVALVTPVIEEWVFRGWLQGRLLPERFRRTKWAGLTQANIITSIVFVSLHFLYHPPLWAASVLFPSLLFGYFRDRHKGIGACVALHIFFNMGFFWLFAELS